MIITNTASEFTEMDPIGNTIIKSHYIIGLCCSYYYSGSQMLCQGDLIGYNGDRVHDTNWVRCNDTDLK